MGCGGDMGTWQGMGGTWDVGGHGNAMGCGDMGTLWGVGGIWGHKAGVGPSPVTQGDQWGHHGAISGAAIGQQ